jgi:hypothetical protein
MISGDIRPVNLRPTRLIFAIFQAKPALTLAPILASRRNPTARILRPDSPPQPSRSFPSETLRAARFSADRPKLEKSRWITIRISIKRVRSKKYFFPAGIIGKSRKMDKIKKSPLAEPASSKPAIRGVTKKTVFRGTSSLSGGLFPQGDEQPTLF